MNAIKTLETIHKAVEIAKPLMGMAKAMMGSHASPGVGIHTTADLANACRLAGIPFRHESDFLMAEPNIEGTHRSVTLQPLDHMVLIAGFANSITAQHASKSAYQNLLRANGRERYGSYQLTESNGNCFLLFMIKWPGITLNEKLVGLLANLAAVTAATSPGRQPVSCNANTKSRNDSSLIAAKTF